MTELTPGSGTQRLTLFGHGLAGLMAGCTRYTTRSYLCRLIINICRVSAIVATPVELLKGNVYRLVLWPLAQLNYAHQSSSSSSRSGLSQIADSQGP
jgi:hypothetical protein